MFLIQFVSHIWKFITTMHSYQMYFLSLLLLMVMKVPLFVVHIRLCLKCTFMLTFHHNMPVGGW